LHIATSKGSIDIPNVDPRRPNPDETLCLAMETLRMLPLNGLRYPLAEGSSGWYIWGGEQMLQTADFFSAVKVRDVGDYLPNIAPFLALPPGFRFRIEKGASPKAWFDGKLLDV
jgi:hypothetical protein